MTAEGGDFSAHLRVTADGTEVSNAGRQELAGNSVGSRKRFVQSGERELERLGNGDVPRVVTCHVVTQFPDAVGEGLKGKQLYIELQEILLRRIRLWRCN